MVLSAGGVVVPHKVYAIPSVVFYLLVLGFCGTGLYLLLMASQDARARPLGMFLLLIGSSFSRRLLDDFAAAVPSLSSVLSVQRVPVEAFLAYFFWCFIADFPRRLADFRKNIAFMLRVSFVAGAVLFGANMAAVASAVLPASLHVALPKSVAMGGAVYWGTVFGLMVPGFPYAYWKSRQASADERRRVSMVLAGVIFGFGPTLIIVLLEFLPRFDAFLAVPANLRAVGIVVYPALLAIPATTAYAVLVHRALDLQTIVRRALQYAVARWAVAAVAGAPFAVALGILYAGRNRTLAELWSGESGLLLVGLLALGGLLMGYRSQIQEWLDRRFFRERHDARAILGGVVDRIRAVRTAEELAAILAAEIDHALHLRSIATLLADPATGALAAPDGAVAPLDGSWRLTRRLEGEGEPVEIDWSRPPAWLSRLPQPEQQWLTDADARLLVPVTSADGALRGVMALGEKRSELPFSAEDRQLLSTIAASVALAVESRLLRAPATPADAADAGDAPARECPACGAVAAQAEVACARCGGATAAAAVPLVLAAKYRLLERIGSGGMGVVYRAVDVTLDREVAIKTLPQMSPREARWLRKEARSMAAVTHPGLAQIYSAESWHAVPMLVVEFLPGGTLGDRLKAGPLSAANALAIVTPLAAALGRLHDAGILHRDIKPNNIAFSADGMPRLLDFGVARAIEAAHLAEAAPARWNSRDSGPARAESTVGTVAGDLAGTLLYLSPEVVSGDPPDVAADVWALCMVLYEAVAGRHPFADETQHWAAVRISEADVPDVCTLAPAVPAPLAEFLRAALGANLRKRPQSARELEERLRALQSASAEVFAAGG